MAIEFFSVLTKTYDGGQRPAGPADATRDAFAYYSDDAVRMRVLLMKKQALDDVPRARPVRADADAAGGAGAGAAAATARTSALPRKEALDAGPQAAEGARPRKTKISFELHPGLLCEDFFEDLP